MVPLLLPEAPRVPVAKKGAGTHSRHTASVSAWDSQMKQKEASRWRGSWSGEEAGGTGGPEAGTGGERTGRGERPEMLRERAVLGAIG